MLTRALKITKNLNLKSIVCVFDQAIYSKAVEIKWKEPAKFQSCVIMMGMFHMLMVYMHILSKRFSDAGLRDVLIQSGVVAEASCERALLGKMYKRGVRLYKTAYESVLRILLKYIDENSECCLFQNINDVLGKDLETLGIEETLEHEKVVELYTNFVNTRCEMIDEANENTLQGFWISFLDMIELLLNTISAIRSGRWELLLECIRDIIPYAFAYDNINYARYLTGMLGEMLELPSTFPEVYEEFVNGNFAVQLQNNYAFSRSEADKVIETTINKDTKTPGGTTGFSTNDNAVHRWEVNAAYRAALRACFHKHLNYRPQNGKHPDLNLSRISRDESDVLKVISTLENTFINPLTPCSLVSISTGIIPNKKTTQDLMKAREIGLKAMEQLIETRMKECGTLSFFDTIKKKKLATFSTMNKTKTVKLNNKEIPLRASKDLFAKIAIISQKRTVDLKATFKFPLSSIPWSIAEPTGTLKKTSKATLLHKLEGQVEPMTIINEKHALVIDGMALVQMTSTTKMTFEQLAKTLLSKILSMGAFADRVDVVFDDYREVSIKNIERLRRNDTCSLLFQQIIPTTEIKQWGMFLSSGNNKNALIKFLTTQ